MARPGNSLAGAVCLSAVVLLLGPRPCSGQQWADTRVSGPFLCRAEFPLSSVEPLLAELDQLQRDLVRTLGIPPAQERIELYLFRSKASYQRYLYRHLPRVPYRRALYVKGRGPGKVLAYFSSEFEIDVRHECTHALLHAVLPVVPLWLDEGLAEYFEVPADERAFDNPHLASLRWNLMLGMVPRMQGLEKKDDLVEMGQSEYRCAWAWVHFMLHGPRPAHAELVAYLQDLRAGTPPGILSRRLDRRLPSSQRRLVAHFKGWNR